MALTYTRQKPPHAFTLHADKQKIHVHQNAKPRHLVVKIFLTYKCAFPILPSIKGKFLSGKRTARIKESLHPHKRVFAKLLRQHGKGDRPHPSGLFRTRRALLPPAGAHHIRV
jgi:hypothetical protein